MDNTDNQRLINVCSWDHGDKEVVLVIDFEVFYREEYLANKLPCEVHDAKIVGEQKSEQA